MKRLPNADFNQGMFRGGVVGCPTDDELAHTWPDITLIGTRSLDVVREPCIGGDRRGLDRPTPGQVKNLKSYCRAVLFRWSCTCGSEERGSASSLLRRQEPLDDILERLVWLSSHQPRPFDL